MKTYVHPRFPAPARYGNSSNSIFRGATRRRVRTTSFVVAGEDICSMAKPAVVKPAPSKKKNGTKKNYSADPALRWQLGGLIAGVAVALLAATQPGKKVK